jgi:hypothetical protein
MSNTRGANSKGEAETLKDTAENKISDKDVLVERHL